MLTRRLYSTAASAPTRKAKLPSETLHQFYQTIVHSDGSTFTLRCTTPRPLLRMTKDTRNHPLWNPEKRRDLDKKTAELQKFKERFGDALEDANVLSADTPSFGFQMGQDQKK